MSELISKIKRYFIKNKFKKCAGLQKAIEAYVKTDCDDWSNYKRYDVYVNMKVISYKHLKENHPFRDLIYKPMPIHLKKFIKKQSAQWYANVVNEVINEHKKPDFGGDSG